MATSTAKTQCFSCSRDIRTFKCEGCSQKFCLNCLTEHIQTISKQLDEIENDHDQFRQKLNNQKDDTKQNPWIKEIDQWENDSINKIKQIAQQCRQKLINYTNKFIIEIENRLNVLVKELKLIRQENEFNEIDLNQFKEKLKVLKEELNQLPDVAIEQQSTSFINKILVITPFDKDTKWKQVGITVAGSNGDGSQLNQLCNPYGICIDDDQTIYIADFVNNRIVKWICNATNGQIVAGGNGEGNQTNQLNRPTDVIIDKPSNSLIISDQVNRRVMQWSLQNNTNGQIIISDIDCCGLAMDKHGSLYVSDYKKNEVRRWKRGDQNGTIVAGGNGKGNHLNQLNSPTFIVVDEDYTLYVSDLENHRVMKWVEDAKEGIVAAGGDGKGIGLTQLSSPYGLIIDPFGQIYVVDSGNDRVMRWCRGAKEGTIVVGGNGEGQQSNQFNGPKGLAFDRQGNLYVVDWENDRIQKFETDCD